jgi:hypothetical protein
MIIIFIIGIVGVVGIRYVLTRIYENYIINMVLSKLDFSSKNHRIIRKDNNIYIKCHKMIENVFVYNDETIDKYQYNSFIGSLKIVDINIDMINKTYKIVITAFHLLNTRHNIILNFNDKIDDKSYYFINDLIDEDYNIDYDLVILCNIKYPDYYNKLKYKYTETSQYDKYICKKYNIILTNGIETIYLKSILNTFPNNSYNTISNNSFEPLLSNEIRIKKIECSFLNAFRLIDDII